MVALNQGLEPRLRAGSPLSWLGPLPLWARPSPAGLRVRDRQRVGHPAILRFDNDDFMREYLAVLGGEPHRLGEWLAQPETWREPMPTPDLPRPPPSSDSAVAFLYQRTRQLTAARRPPASAALNLERLKGRRGPLAVTPSTADAPLKLYQAVHKRHYLVTASLISDEPGLPDCEPALERQEKATFVLRRLLPAENADAGDAGKEAVELDVRRAAVEPWDEYAFVPGPRGDTWQRIGAHGSAATLKLAAGEEQLPMFPVPFHDSCDAQRRLLTGIVPVSRREALVGASIAGSVADTGAAPAVDAAPPRGLAAVLFQADVVAPWKLLLEQAQFKADAADGTFENFGRDQDAEARERLRLLRTARDEIQTGSWYVLLDFAQFLHTHLNGVWRVIAREGELDELDEDEQALVNVLRSTALTHGLASSVVTRPFLPLLQLVPFGGSLLTPLPPQAFVGLFGLLGSGVGPLAQEYPRYSFLHVRWNLADALVAALEAKDGLEGVETGFTRYDEDGGLLDVDPKWPDFLFPLADPVLAPPTPAVVDSELDELSGVERSQKAVDVLAAMVEALLPPPQPEDGHVESVPVGDRRAAWFVVRCVYERPQCGPLFAPLVSAPSRPFQMAPFFDPDAPVRPVRIPMPLDISPAGLRKYQKNAGLVVSDVLCGQIKRVRKLTLGDLVLSVLPWPFHKDLPDPAKTGPCGDDSGSFGMVCSLSIPIVTMCALILLLIIAALFDMFFRWLPYLFVCLPIPGLKGKQGEGSVGAGR